jgi:PspC domain
MPPNPQSPLQREEPHFHTDPTLVRAVFIALALCGGAGLVIYLALWIAVPKRQTADSARYTERQGKHAA